MFRAILCTSSGVAVQCTGWERTPLPTGALHSRSQRVTIPDAVEIQFWPPEDEHSIARNMPRYLLYYIYNRINKLCIKLVIKTSLYYDARSEKHHIKLNIVAECGSSWRTPDEIKNGLEVRFTIFTLASVFWSVIYLLVPTYDLFLLNTFCSWLSKSSAYVVSLLFIIVAKILYAILSSKIPL
jgi:hypothetical protein